MRRRRLADTLSEIDTRLEREGFSLLSEEDRAQIRDKAKEHVTKQRRDKAEADYLAEAIREEERSYTPADQFESIVIELAPFVASARFNSAFIALDGTRYYHGLTYTLPRKVVDTIRDIMARGWEHEREIHGESRKADINRRPIHGYLGPQHANTTTSLRRSLG